MFRKAQNKARPTRRPCMSIEVILRIKPDLEHRPSRSLSLDPHKLEFITPQKEIHGFRFNRILLPEAEQEEVCLQLPMQSLLTIVAWMTNSLGCFTQAQVFERVARPVVTGFLEGHNGVIFVYGATGSGKTYTVGSAMHGGNDDLDG